MINKKIFLSFLMLFVFSLIIYADGKNFVTILNGANIANSATTTSYSFVGQPVVFNTKETNDYTSQSAFASVFYSVQSPSISFTNNTGSEPFTDVAIDLKVTIKSTAEDIVNIQYRIWQGENPDWNDWEKSPAHSYDISGASDKKNINFLQNVAFSEGNSVNFFRVYAQLANGEKRWSSDYTVNISSGLSGKVEIVAPDKISKTASVDPQVESTPYSINLTSTTITLLEGNEDSTTKVYTVTVSSSTDGNEYGLYDNDLGKIIYTHSKFADLYNKKHQVSIPRKLKNNATYTLVIESQNNGSATIDVDKVTFKTLSGGVADILPYPSPFNPKKQNIKIRYLLGNDARVTIKIYDKAGKIVSKLIQSEYRSAGTNEEEWNGRNYAGETLATGAYIIEIIANSSSGEDRRYTALAIVGK